MAAVQSETSLLWVSHSLTLIPAIFMALSLLMIIKYPITKGRFHQIMDSLERRKNGEEIDLEKMKYLL